MHGGGAAATADSGVLGGVMATAAVNARRFVAAAHARNALTLLLLPAAKASPVVMLRCEHKVLVSSTSTSMMCWFGFLMW